MTEQIANLLVNDLKVRGAGVIIEAEHTCMTIRGIQKKGSVAVTSAMKGTFRKDERTRTEILHLIFSSRK